MTRTSRYALDALDWITWVSILTAVGWLVSLALIAGWEAVQ